jgi:mannosyltransferase
VWHTGRGPYTESSIPGGAPYTRRAMAVDVRKEPAAFAAAPRSAARRALRSPGVPLAGIVAIAALLRFPTLDLQSYWFDESVTVVDTVRPGFFETLRAIPDMEVTPPLYFVLAWLWAQPFGEGEVGLRSLSALVGVLTVPVAYAAAARLVSRRAALAGAALVALHPLLVWYSQEARAYSLLALLGALSFLFFVRAVQGERRALTWWALASALALATHYFAVFVVIAEAVWLLVLAARRRERVRSTALAVAGVAGAGAALIPLVAHQFGGGGADWVDSQRLGERIDDGLHKLLLGPPDPVYSRKALALAMLVFVLWLLYRLVRWLVGLVRARRLPHPLAAARRFYRERPGAALALTVGLAGVVTPLVMAIFGVDYFLHRYLLAAAVPLLIGVVGIVEPRRRLAAVAFVLACSAYLTLVVASFRDPIMQRPDWRDAAKALGPVRTDRAVVLDPFWPEQLWVYGHGLGGMPPQGWKVREIAAIRHINAPAPATPLRFRRVERHQTNHLVVTRFVADARRRVTPTSLEKALAVPRGTAGLQLRPGSPPPRRGE